MKALTQAITQTLTQKISRLVLASTLIFTSSAFAHGDGHSKLDQSKIIQAAQTSAKMLTFKDKGMSVGKLDSSWNKVAKGAFKLVEETDNAIIVKATNTNNQQTLLFNVSKGGKVLDVKEAKSQSGEHGHSHGHAH
ncbi:DUF6488 family protein [Thalassotalea euphylliae]|uniref:PepSY domain-containing protein n=1 Tax=Thalassotalea euphylliae TaxID=1655234 RepID=A0A3E0UF49_9GAMM|nr:DUF6488 family protein [Thalassotalea euphylliae]REL35641.1 hypothetical protein DXX92_09905 [Thalassotalea euphylliae]